MLHDLEQSSLFPELSSEQLQQVAVHGREVELAAGEILFAEGDLSYDFYVVLDGEIEIAKRIDGKEQVIAVHHAGHFTGEISMLSGRGAIATGRAVVPSRVLRITREAFNRMISECSAGAQVILTALAGRTQDVEIQLRQQEKLAALGKLAAGLAHELNNPAAAGCRSAKQLRQAIADVQSRTLKLSEQNFSATQRQLLNDLQQAAIACSAPNLDPLTQSDREDTLADWLDQQGISNSWQLAPTLVSSGIEVPQLEAIALEFDATALESALHWLEASLTVAGLVDQIEQSTMRIAGLVKAVKAYSYMDQAPIQEIDLHEGLDNTLTILKHKLKYGITVERQYDPTLPRICAYGSELNQVWTNLIDNASAAMQGKGKITLRTSREHDQVKVEIIDNGPGIPPEIQSRIFEPFFTTKGVGEGTGLGLDIARRIVVQKHQGDIQFNSQPGNTRFRICLPIKPPKS